MNFLYKEKLWKSAKKIILGGNSLLSKRPEMFLPEYWPTYYSRAKGVHVWDLNNKKYTDMVFAVGTNTLGYCNKVVDSAVKKAISNGNMCSLNSPHEVELANKLVKLHPWSSMVKFARSGGEANALVIRIARAASKKDNIAVCGYHGWHDWYLSINLKNKDALSKHLLPGLEPAGVPKYLKNTVHAFTQNNFDKLEFLCKKFDIGTVKLEIARDHLPNIVFLRKLRKFCNKKNIILIFDECTSGFRRNLGGIHMTTGVYPDLAMFGKAIGNGYAITAVIGRKKFMKKAEKSFISSTMWTESVGFVAANATINYMKKNQSYKTLIKNGKYINKKWEQLASKYNLKINISGTESITSFSFPGPYNLILKTFITQEMLRYNYLASNLIYISICHNKKVIDKYIFYLDKVFKKIKIFLDSKTKKNILKGSVCHTTFKRLTD